MTDEYRVSVPQAVRDELINRLKRAALTEGENRQIRTALATAEDRLRNAPAEFGEARYHLPHLNLEIRIAIVDRLWVHFGVNKEKRVVIVNKLGYMGLSGDG